VRLCVSRSSATGASIKKRRIGKSGHAGGVNTKTCWHLN